MISPQTHTCPSCKSGVMELFHEVDAVPVNSCILLDSPEAAASYPRGDVRLGFCPRCGFISNLAFDPRLAEYSSRYEETQGFSATFRTFHHSLARRLIDSYGLHGKQIIEIGCGKGEFLMLLCELGENRGVGFDPGVRPERIEGDSAGRMHFVRDFYSEKYADCRGDFLVCKMTLEHIHPTGDFMAMVRHAIGERDGVGVFFQIPEAERILRDCAFEDIYYEHCSYFSAGSVARLFRMNGFEVLNLAKEYQGQYLTIEARTAANAVDQRPLPEERDIGRIEQFVKTFSARFETRRAAWQMRLDHYAEKGLNVVLWGAGSKAVSLLSTLAGTGVVKCAVDINPYRQGHFLPGTGLPIIGPAELCRQNPDVVVIMNPIYRDEIGRDLDKMGLKPQIVTL